MMPSVNIYSGDIGIIFNIGDNNNDKITGDVLLLKLV